MWRRSERTACVVMLALVCAVALSSCRGAQPSPPAAQQSVRVVQEWPTGFVVCDVAVPQATSQVPRPPRPPKQFVARGCQVPEHERIYLQLFDTASDEAA